MIDDNKAREAYHKWVQFDDAFLRSKDRKIGENAIRCYEDFCAHSMGDAEADRRIWEKTKQYAGYLLIDDQRIRRH